MMAKEEVRVPHTSFYGLPVGLVGWLVGRLAGWLGGAAGQGPDLPREEGPHDCQA